MTRLPGRPPERRPSPAMVATAEARFWKKVDRTEGCWTWTASTNGAGYGVLAMSRDGMKVLAHRFSYELAYGPIPPGLVIDHLCRNTRCVNPSHLEAVTQKVNNLRGGSPSSQQAKQTHCKRGHEFVLERTPSGRRRCRRCHALGESIRYYRRAGRPVPQRLLDEWGQA